MALPSETVSLAGSGLVFVNTYSSTVTDAYRGAIVQAENYLQGHFSNSITITADFDLAALGAHQAATNSFFTVRASYASLTGALRAHATTADDFTAVNGLPLSDPSLGVGWAVPTPEARMLGLTTLTNAEDITVTLNSNLAWSYGQDAVGAILHELTEGAFGRVGSLGVQASHWMPMDLFRFAASGARDFTGGQDGVPTYFGLDSAHVFTGYMFHNAVDSLGTDDGQDLADWDVTIGDSFGPGGPSEPGVVSATDLRVLDVLGWTPSTTAGQVSSSPTTGDDRITGAAGGDTIDALAGNDTITGGTGQNYLRGNDGNDSISGGSGFNDINGNKGDDTIVGHSTVGDWLVGGQGNDSIASGGSNNILYGNLGNDTLVGSGGGEIIRGGQGDDSIVAGSGTEWLSGDRGNDTLQAGSGADTFHTFSGAGLDEVIGFKAGTDHVQVDPGTTYSVSQVGADVVISLGGSDEMILKSVSLSSLQSGWIFTG